MAATSTEAKNKSEATKVLLPVLLLALALLLVLYIGYGKARHTYPDLRLASLAAVGETVQQSLETYLQAGLPLQQFVGFATITEPLLRSEPAIAEIRVVDQAGQVVFSNRLSGQAAPLEKALLLRSTEKYRIYETGRLYILSRALQSKFETVADLQITTGKALIGERLKRAFLPPVSAAAILLVAYFLLALYSGKSSWRRAQFWLKAAYAAAFLIVAVLMIITLVGLLSGGIRDKARALSRSLGARLNAALDIGIDLSSFTELETIFSEYRQLNPEIEFIALTEDGSAAIHTEPGLRGKSFAAGKGVLLFSERLRSRPAEMQIRLGISKSLLLNALWRYGKDFLVLLIASAFLSALFLNLAISFRRRQEADPAGLPLEAEQAMKRDLVKPVYFLAIFMEGLHASFLPQYLRSTALSAGLGAGAASAVFMAYFAAYTLTIIPAGWYAERRGSKTLIAAGALLSAGGLLLISLFHSFALALLFRMISGAGGGLLFIGVQSYILRHTTRETRTQGGTIIVYGYNGGTMSGAAIGAMLALYVGMKGVFVLGAAVGLTLLLYSLRYIPRVTASEASAAAQPQRQHNARSLLKVFVDSSFLKTVFLVGIPTKVILTGITIYALPLLLSGQGYLQEDIGQILMFYAAGVLLSSRYASRLADRLGNTARVLFLGMLGAGAGLGLIGLMGAPASALPSPGLASALLVISGMLVVGLAHGFIHAPVVTHITETRSARALGQAGVASLYRFLERIGHVTGPLIVGGILAAMNENTLSISLVGAATALFGLLFAAGRRVQPPAPKGEQDAG